MNQVAGICWVISIGVNLSGALLSALFASAPDGSGNYWPAFVCLMALMFSVCGLSCQCVYENAIDKPPAECDPPIDKAKIDWSSTIPKIEWGSTVPGIEP